MSRHSSHHSEGGGEEGELPVVMVAALEEQQPAVPVAATTPAVQHVPVPAHPNRLSLRPHQIVNNQAMMEVDVTNVPAPPAARMAKVAAAADDDLDAAYAAADAAHDDLDSDDGLLMDAEDLQRVHALAKQAELDEGDFDLSAEYTKPSMQVALANRRYHMPSRADGSQYSIWQTKTGRFLGKRGCGGKVDCFQEGHRSQLIAFGAGVSAYFKLLKVMAALFVVLGLLSVPLIYINVRGGDYFRGHPVPLAATTLGNLYAGTALVDGQLVLAPSTLLPEVFTAMACRNATNSTHPTTPELVCPFDPEDVLLFYCAWDAAMMLGFFLAINIFHRFTRNENRVYKRKISKIEDYSVQMSVPLGADAHAIQHHFEHADKFHATVKVFDVQVVEKTGNALQICVQRGKLLRRFARLDATRKMLLAPQAVEQRAAAPSMSTTASPSSPPTSTFTPFAPATAPMSAKELERLMQRNDRRIQHVTERIGKLDHLAQHRVDTQQGQRALMAFVTFETQEAKLRVLDEYENDAARCCSGCGCRRQSKRLQFVGKEGGALEPLRVQSAPPPSTILWENQEVGHRRARVGLAMLFFLAILLVTAALSFVTDQNRVITNALNSMDSSSGTSNSTDFCSGRYSNLTTLTDQLAQIRAHGDEACFCNSDRTASQLLLPTPPSLVEEERAAALCDAYVADLAQSVAKLVGFSVLVIVINIIVYRVVQALAEHLIKFRNVLARELAVMRVIFVITLINTGLIILLVNTDWERISGAPFVSIVAEDGTVFVESGDFVDFEPDWYAKVGVEIFILSVLNIFGPYLLPLARYAYHMLEQFFAAKHAVSQQALNDLFLGEEFLLSVRLAQMLTMVFFTLAFSSGIPLMYWSALGSFVVAFWFDKFFFLRLARTPPQFDTMLQEWALQTLEWAVVLHCMLGFWMYSSPRMFPATAQSFTLFQVGNGNGNDNNNNNDDDDDDNSSPVLSWDAASSAYNFGPEFAFRLARTGPVILLFVGLLVVATKFVRRFGRAFWGCLRCCGSTGRSCFRLVCGNAHINHKLSKAVMAAEPFHVLLERGHVAGVTSYNILANPVYQTMFQMQRVAVNGGADRMTQQMDDTESAVSSPQPGSRRFEFQSLQDALNIRKETAVDSIQGRWLQQQPHPNGSSRSLLGGGAASVRSHASTSDATPPLGSSRLEKHGSSRSQKGVVVVAAEMAEVDLLAVSGRSSVDHE